VARSRTDRRPLSRERVLAAAMAIADAEGIAAVTMRRLASKLGVEPMSLYYHLPGKDALLDGVVDAVVAEIALAIEHGDDESQGWQATLRRRCLSARDVMERHPWAPGLIASRTTIPASLFAYYEEILATLVGGGFSYHLAHRAVHALGSMAVGFAQELFSPASAGDDLDGAAEADLAALADTLPHLTSMVAAELHDNAENPLGWCDSRAEFEFTLDLLLDGLARANGASEGSRA
jgi:AcrR family transcriptional regulator